MKKVAVVIGSVWVGLLGFQAFYMVVLRPAIYGVADSGEISFGVRGFMEFLVIALLALPGVAAIRWGRRRG